MKRTLLFAIFCFCITATKAQWLNQNAGFTNRTLGFYEFSIVNQNTVWAICYDGIGGLFGPNQVLDFTRTTDGGTTWRAGSVSADSTLAFSNICALSGAEAWVAMHKFNLSKGGGLFHTTDSGMTWNQSNAGVVFDSNSFPNFVYFKNPLEGIAGGDINGGYFEVYTTGDGGVTWTRTPQANIPAMGAGAGGGWFDGYCVIGDTVWFGTDGGEMYKSTDFGQTWSVHTVSLTPGHTVYEIAFNDDGQHGLTHVRSNTATMLFATSDGGITWTQLPSHPKWKRDRITSVPGTNMFVSTSTQSANRGSAYTTDYGVTWIQIEATKAKGACRFLNSTTGWAGGFFSDQFPVSGGIFKWDATTPLMVIEHGVNKDLKIFPNPATDWIQVTTSAGSAKCDLQFYNAVGTLVKEVDNIDSKEINIAELPTGLYFIKSKSDLSINSKFIKS